MFENYTKGLDSSIKRTWSLVHYTKAMIPTWTLHKSLNMAPILQL